MEVKVNSQKTKQFEIKITANSKKEAFEIITNLVNCPSSEFSNLLDAMLMIALS